MIYSLLLVFFLVILCFNYRNGVCMVASLSVALYLLVWNKVQLYDGLSFVAAILLLTKVKLNRVDRYPFMMVSIMMITAYVFTNLFSGNPHWPTTALTLIGSYLMPIVLWYSLASSKSMKPFRAFIKCTYFFLWAIVVYAFFEFITDSNPFIEYGLDNELFGPFVALSERYRFGIRRLQSFMALNGALGIVCNLGAIFISYLLHKGDVFLTRQKLSAKILIVFLILVSLFTGTRSVYVGTVISLLYVMIGYGIQLKRVVSILTLLAIALMVFAPFFTEIASSFTDTSSTDGSNADMRKGQFLTSFYYMMNAGLFGHGTSFTSDLMETNPGDIFGAESIWMPLMMNLGIYGVVSYLAFIIFIFYYCVKNKNTACVFVLLSFILTKTLTSAPGIYETYFLMYIIFIISYNKFDYAKIKMARDI